MEYVRQVVKPLTNRATLVRLVILVCTTVRIFAERYANFLKLENEDTRFEAAILPERPMSITSCFTLCSIIEGCIYVSYQNGSHLCGFHDKNVTAVTSLGWDIYFKRLDEIGKTAMDLKTGATAYQSSNNKDEPYMTADLALDGNTSGDVFNTVSCSYTSSAYSYWIMQFGMPGVVNEVDIYMRSDIHYVNGNSDRVLMVAQTYDDAVNNVGIECGRYFGEPIDSPPFVLTVQCNGPIFGKFLRISHHHSDIWMVNCEVFVYAP